MKTFLRFTYNNIMEEFSLQEKIEFLKRMIILIQEKKVTICNAYNSTVPKGRMSNISYMSEIFPELRNMIVTHGNELNKKKEKLFMSSQMGWAIPTGKDKTEYRVKKIESLIKDLEKMS